MHGAVLAHILDGKVQTVSKFLAIMNECDGIELGLKAECFLGSRQRVCKVMCLTSTAQVTIHPETADEADKKTHNRCIGG